MVYQVTRGKVDNGVLLGQGLQLDEVLQAALPLRVVEELGGADDGLCCVIV